MIGWVLDGRSRDPFWSRRIDEASLMFLWGCTPSELRKEDAGDVLLYGLIYREILRRLPKQMGGMMR